MLFNTNPIIAKLLKKFRLDLNYIYNDQFATTDLRAKTWVDIFANLIIKKFHPKSIIDFGCGTGDIIQPFEKYKIKILGVDGSKYNFLHRKIHENNFLIFDLRNKFQPPQKYGLCFCLEVAEHIEEKYTETLISNLTRSSDLIIFTAAAPDQRGHDHVTLKEPAWWVDQFKRKGFFLNHKTTEQLRTAMKKIDGIQPWYINNLQIYNNNSPSNSIS